MNNFLLLYFALPVAITILSIIFETLINCPIKIAGITFSIFTILYTILSYVVAWITKQWTQNQCSGTSLEDLIQEANSNNNSCGCSNRRRIF